jgi:hypothetical protein
MFINSYVCIDMENMSEKGQFNEEDEMLDYMQQQVIYCWAVLLYSYLLLFVC